jgi:FkbM family methyltransferase
MKVTVFLPSLAGGGAERTMLTVAGELSRRGHDVELLTARAGGQLVGAVDGGVRHEAFGVGHARSAVPRLARHLRRSRPDVLLAAMDHGNLAAVLAAATSRTGVPVVVSYHNHVSTAARRGRSPIQALRPAVLRRVVGRAAHVVAVSQGVAADLEAIAPAVRGRVTAIYNPTVREALFALAEEPLPDRPEAREPDVLAVGRLAPQKGFDVLVRAFARLRERHPSARLTILGEGPQREPLEELVRELALEDAVSLPGAVENPFPYMARCRAFVLSSRWEGLGNVLVEAGVLGAPLVATDCPSGPRELVSARPRAQLVPPEDVTALAAAIERAREMPRGRPSPEGWHEHTVTASVDAYESVLRAVTAADGSGVPSDDDPAPASLRERLTLPATSLIQATAGRLAEPLAVKVALPLIRTSKEGRRTARRGGLVWDLDLSDNLQRRLYYAGSYERATIRAVVDRLRPGDVVLDVGANIGSFALPLARAGASVVAVEASSETVSHLRRHVTMNGLQRRVEIVHAALGRSDGRLDLRAGAQPGDSGLRTLAGSGEVVETVDVVPGDRLGSRPDIVKVDVEGGELAVLEGMPEVLDGARMVVVEVVPGHQARAGESAEAPVDHLTARGFAPFLIRNRGLEPWSGQAGNVLFLR